MLGKTEQNMGTSASILANKEGDVAISFTNTYEFECFDREGVLKWKESINNIVVNVGLDDILNTYYKGSGYTASHFIGLTDGTPTPAAADTMASHAGWVEVASYTEGVRPTLTLGNVASQSVDNSASKAVYNWTGAATIGGAFVATSGTKSETASTLVGIAAFTGGDKVMGNGDILNVTVTLTAATA